MKLIRTLISGTMAWFATLFFALAVWSAPRDKNSIEEYAEEGWNGGNEDDLTEIELSAKRLYFTGSCYHVNNWIPHPAANRDYYVTALRNPDNPELTDVYMFTERELINAQTRADNNKEDIPTDIADFDRVIDRGDD